MLSGKCDCGKVTISIPELPQEINKCPCDYCSRVVARWGYFAAGTTAVKGATDTYRRSSNTIEFHRCCECGVVTHWIDPTGGVRHMGVHMANFDQSILAVIPIVVAP